MNRKRLAVVGVGMIGSGALQQGIPAMAMTLEKLSESVDVTVYSFIPISRSKVSKQIRIRYAPALFPQFLKFYWLFIIFCLDHFISKYDCVHAQSPFPAGKLALYTSLIFKIHWVTTIHAGEIANLPNHDFGDFRKNHLRQITTEICNKSNELIFMSQWQANDLERNLGIKRKINIIPRGGEVGILKPRRIISPIKLLHVGFNHPIKNQDMLLRVLKILTGKHQCELKIIGSNYGEEFVKMISRMNLNRCVSLTGVLPHHEMSKQYQNADFLIHTSWFEGLPMVAVEAMSQGAVVCGTNVGIMADLSGTCCVTAPVGDADALAKAILDLAEDSARYESIRLQAYEWAKSHDINWHIAELKKVFLFKTDD